LLLLSKISISSLLAIQLLISYQAKAKALPTATVSNFSNAFSLSIIPKELQLKTHLLVVTVALKLTISQSTLNSVNILALSVWSL